MFSRSTDKMLSLDFPPSPAHGRVARLTFVLLALLSFIGTSQPAHAQFAPVTWLTRDTAARDMWPRVAPDGRTVTFSRSRDGGATFVLMRTTMAGGRARLLFAGLQVGSATRGDWSRRQRRFAFTARMREDDDGGEVWVTGARGARPTRLTLRWPSRSILYPTWSPGGRELVAQDWDTPDGPMLLEIDLRTGAVTPLTDPRKMFAAGLTLSPDGEWIAFVGQPNEGQRYDQKQNHMYVMRRRGGEAPREISSGQGRQPDWSPDGRWIAFTSTRGDPSGRQAVFAVSPDGGELVQLTEHTLDAGHPVWSPDGRRLVFSALLPGSKQAYGLAMIRVPVLSARHARAG